MGFQDLLLFFENVEQLKEVIKTINTYTNRKAIANSWKK